MEPRSSFEALQEQMERTIHQVQELEEAARMFEQARAYEEATVESNDGPRVTPLAERRLREIGQ